MDIVTKKVNILVTIEKEDDRMSSSYIKVSKSEKNERGDTLITNRNIPLHNPIPHLKGAVKDGFKWIEIGTNCKTIKGELRDTEIEFSNSTRLLLSIFAPRIEGAFNSFYGGSNVEIMFSGDEKTYSSTDEDTIYEVSGMSWMERCKQKGVEFTPFSKIERMISYKKAPKNAKELYKLVSSVARQTMGYECLFESFMVKNGLPIVTKFYDAAMLSLSSHQYNEIHPINN